MTSIATMQTTYGKSHCLRIVCTIDEGIIQVVNKLASQHPPVTGKWHMLLRQQSRV